MNGRIITNGFLRLWVQRKLYFVVDFLCISTFYICYISLYLQSTSSKNQHSPNYSHSLQFFGIYIQFFFLKTNFVQPHDETSQRFTAAVLLKLNQFNYFNIITLLYMILISVCSSLFSPQTNLLRSNIHKYSMLSVKPSVELSQPLSTAVLFKLLRKWIQFNYCNRFTSLLFVIIIFLNVLLVCSHAVIYSSDRSIKQ